MLYGCTRNGGELMLWGHLLRHTWKIRCSGVPLGPCAHPRKLDRMLHLIRQHAGHGERTGPSVGAGEGARSAALDPSAGWPPRGFRRVFAGAWSHSAFRCRPVFLRSLVGLADALVGSGRRVRSCNPELYPARRREPNPVPGGWLTGTNRQRGADLASRDPSHTPYPGACSGPG